MSFRLGNVSIFCICFNFACIEAHNTEPIFSYRCNKDWKQWTGFLTLTLINKLVQVRTHMLSGLTLVLQANNTPLEVHTDELFHDMTCADEVTRNQCFPLILKSFMQSDSKFGIVKHNLKVFFFYFRVVYVFLIHQATVLCFFVLLFDFKKN